MHAQLAHTVSLDDVAKVAAVSKHHFPRLFSRSAGVTPYRCLTRLRMPRALLSTTQDRRGLGARRSSGSPPSPLRSVWR